MKKNIVIGVLIVIILIMGGTLFYLNNNKDKIRCTSNAPETNTSIEKEDSSLPTKTLEESKSNENYINAVYLGDTNSSTEVVLFDDGKCMELHVDSEYNLGTYKIEGNKLILTLEVYDETQTEIYNISNDYSSITTEQGLNLKKLN